LFQSCVIQLTNFKSIAMKFLSLSHLRILLFAMFISLVFYSCKKEGSVGSGQSVSEQDAASYAEEGSQASASYDDVEDVSMMAASEESVNAAPNGRYYPLFDILRARIGLNATITVSPNDSTYPKTITIDFGSAVSVCADNKLRKGSIIIYLTGPILRSGSVMTITLQDFYLNGVHIEGTKTISNLSENGAIKFKAQVAGGKVTYPNGHGYTHEGLKYINQVAGADTKTCIDDVFHIEGTGKTEFSNGVTITHTTQTALVKKIACPWITEGVMKITVNDRVLLLDYSAPNNGDCDNKALLTWNAGASSKIILLP